MNQEEEKGIESPNRIRNALKDAFLARAARNQQTQP